MFWKKWMGGTLAGLLLLCGTARAQDRVVVVEISGAINPVVAEFVETEIQAANASGESLIVLRMDTPGGLDTSMRQIIKAIQISKIPVATFVAPSGSRAASAGTFITMAAHIAAMAPGTNIGAAHPVNLMGGEKEGRDKPTSMEEKILNDASAYIRSLAEARGRNAYWAEQSVRKSVSISAEEAKKLAVIDLIAADLDALVLAVDGREVEVAGGVKVKLATQGKPIVHREMSPRENILDTISNPNVAYILMMIGLVGLYFELSNPGLILPGILGGISMILALYAMQTLPINYAGLLLILLGGVLFIAELNTPTSGLLSAGGVVAILLGSLMLIDTDDPAMQISKVVLYPTLGLSVVLALAILYMANKSARMKIVSGAEGLVGALGVAKTALAPNGNVLVHGELWSAECDGTIEEGEKIIVESLEGLKVKVKKVSPSAQDEIQRANPSE
ncbi:MAG: nodulation protein NfeD [Nitrospinaceae bacterium]|nr:nodulation protein NfeD [Nitrospinaceae bacterium]NIR54448.1 nodulation protein NfeD [Nitrospinaceae bacterium]NIS84867.1 nodulation protein NfeD [Nitrospinaceae bacterium]NIT81679.1 nodulation protein NfeD [Nitrospinaceae bacterium]NIU43950.1 nodulation protein NfeD [Nitrospinaceae bacterium]